MSSAEAAMQNSGPEVTIRTISEVGRPRLRKAHALLAGVGLLASAAVLGTNFDMFDAPDLNPNPGQVPGKTEIKEIDVSKFEGQQTDAVGRAEIRVGEITQQWIDTPDDDGKTTTPHETMVLRDGVYKATWTAGGVWRAAASANGGVKISLPGITAAEVSTITDPTIDESKTGRAALQAIGGLFGDDTDDAVPRENTRTELNKWVSDPTRSGTYQKAVSCIGLAAASQKALTIVDGLGVDAQVETYTPPRAAQPTIDPKLPLIEFQAPDPMNPSQWLNLKGCLETLDSMDFDTSRQSTNPDSSFGLATGHIDKLDLPATNQ